MLGVLQSILCWIKQFGAMTLGAIIDASNAVLAALVNLVNAAVAAWPIGMPSMPTMPTQLVTAFGWVAWSPFPLGALYSFVGFALTVYVAMLVAGPVLRWLKAIS